MEPNKFSREVCHNRDYEKHWSLIFFHEKLCLFSRNLCFQQPLRSYRNKPKKCTVFVKRPSGPLLNDPHYFPCSILRGKKALIFFSLERLPLFKNLCFQQPLRCYGNDPINSQ